MEQPQVFVSFFLDASRPNSDGKCLIKLNIYQKPHKRRYATKFHVTKEDWAKLNSAKLRDEDLKEIKKKLNALQSQAEDVVATIKPFSFVTFEDAFIKGIVTTPTATTSRMLTDWFTTSINLLKANDQVGTAGTYQTTINSINEFKKNLQIQDITPAFLQSYEKHLRSENKSLSTISIYMRNLRSIINKAIKDKFLSRDAYPFKSYEIPTGQNVKKALKDFDINHILTYTPEKADQQKAVDFWIFSYLCSGINFADIIALKPSNISGNYLTFYRQKTIRTKKKDLRPIKVGLNSRALAIIEKYKNTDPQNPYLFSILEAGLSAKTIKNRCQRFIKWVNKRMYEICEDLGIENKTGTYAARHTFSTVMKRKGAPTSFIKDALGHSSVATTENYLDSFEDEVILEYANALTTFNQSVLKAV
ncbi:site-specific integrase [Aridibaculum aurantiacum]|uniref:site-specific integrase n=1 Tax=Aridibaculum aurantiacum TaxID=2810307 RepID=UPI001A95B1C3|nr:site-specific integrase [Aridibaculum aurantiacum]